MARKTQAERKAEYEQSRAAYEQEFASNYLSRLLNLVYDYSNKNPSVFSVDRVSAEEFLFESSQDWDSSWVLPAVSAYSRELESDLLDAESALQRYEDERAEEVRRSAVRAEARRKVDELLTEEERELLGL